MTEDLLVEQCPGQETMMADPMLFKGNHSSLPRATVDCAIREAYSQTAVVGRTGVVKLSDHKEEKTVRDRFCILED